MLEQIRRKVRRLLAIHEEVKELEAVLKQLLVEGECTILTASGCGPIVAATIVGEVGDIRRFKSPAALANTPAALHESSRQANGSGTPSRVPGIVDLTQPSITWLSRRSHEWATTERERTFRKKWLRVSRKLKPLSALSDTW